MDANFDILLVGEVERNRHRYATDCIEAVSATGVDFWLVAIAAKRLW